jgi:hypothetical protein
VWVEGWIGVDDFGAVVDGVVVDGVVGVGVVVVGVVGVELCVAAIAAPPPAVRPNTRAAITSVRFGLRMSLLSTDCETRQASKPPTVTAQ